MEVELNGAQQLHSSYSAELYREICAEITSWQEILSAVFHKKKPGRHRIRKNQ